MASTDNIGFEVDPRPAESVGPFRYRSKQLKRIDANTLSVVPTRMAFFISLILPAVSLALLVVGMHGLAARWHNVSYAWAMAAAGLHGLVIGILFCWRDNGRVTFDLRRERYWTNHRLNGPKLFGRFEGQIDNVAAMQLCRSTKVVTRSRFFSWYQLNLVLSDPPGDRFCLMSHAAAEAVRADGAELAEFLHKPLLDHSDERLTRKPDAETFNRIFGPK